MRKIVLCAAIAALLLFFRCAYAQTYLDCREKGYSGTKEIQNYVVRIHAIHAPTSWGGLACIASVKSLGGKIVYSREAPGISLSTSSGRDFNNDGVPDLLFGYFSGGDSFSWEIFSLGPHPHLIKKFENGYRGILGIDLKDTSHNGQNEIWTRDAAFQFFDHLCHACSPAPILVLHLQGRKLYDVSSKFAPDFDEDIAHQQSEIKPEESTKLKFSKPPYTGLDNTRGTVLQIVLDYLYSGREQEAWKTLDQYWPAGDKNRIHKAILERRRNGILKQVEK